MCWMHWRARARFCDSCRTVWVPASAGDIMPCPACRAESFPRTDPLLIILVTHGGRALLGGPHRFPWATTYSPFAGFVEAGESRENAVAREVLLETGVRVGHVRYHSGGLRPFHGSSRLGFYAETLSDAIIIDSEDLRDVRWFTRAEIAAHENIGFDLPRSDSIARRLIEDWVAIG